MNLLNTKIYLIPFKKKKVVIFDRVNADFVRQALHSVDPRSIIVIDSRRESIYLFAFFSLTFFRLLIHKRNIAIAYYCSIIKYISPEIIITYIDNNPRFYEISKCIEKSKFYAIQNGNRFLYNDSFGTKVKRYKHCYFILRPIYYPVTYLSISDYETNTYYKQCDFQFKNIIPVGSLAAACRYYKSSFPSVPLKPKYDLGIIGDTHFNNLTKGSDTLDVDLLHSYVRLLKQEDDNLQIFYLSKFEQSNINSSDEKYYINKFFDNKVDYFSRDSYSDSLFLAIDSKVVIGTCTTFLREAYGIGIKIIALNTLPKSHLGPYDQITHKHFPTYKDFKDDFYKTLNMKRCNYFNRVAFDALDYNSKQGMSAIENIGNLITKDLNN